MKKILLLALLLVPATGLAIPLEWTLSGSIVQGGTASGSFTYDADTGEFSDIALTTVDTPSGGLLFTTFLAEAPDYGLVFVQEGALPGEPTIAFLLAEIFLSQLTNSGGTLVVNSTRNVSHFAEYFCNSTPYEACEGANGGFVSHWDQLARSNRLTTDPTAVAEPGSLALLGAAGLVAAALRRRRVR